MRRAGLVLIPLLLFSSCTGGEQPHVAGRVASSSPPAGQSTRLRIVGASDVGPLDPAEMYSSLSWFLARGIYRTLTTYADPADGGALVGDLATDAGTSNDDATEWTFHLRSGVKFGPTLGGRSVSGVTGSEIVCDDIKYAFERLFMPSVEAGYPFYFDSLVGAKDFSARGGDLPGVACLDEKTIAFHLSEPAADWP
ncbi:MAG: ABC transporter substrate-binding protein, partial [Actinobacteria bacterium]|nr:ABC transporter substrate-binding protein [Actinomycetota bacterium]